MTDVCTREPELAVMQHMLDAHEKEIANLREIYVVINKLATSVEVLALQTTQMKGDVEKIKVDVEEIKRTPSDDFKRYKQAIITTVIGIIVGALMTGKFLG